MMKYLKKENIENVYSYYSFDDELFYSNEGIIQSDRGFYFKNEEADNCVIDSINDFLFFNFHFYGFLKKVDNMQLIENATDKTGNYILTVKTGGFNNGRLEKFYNLFDIQSNKFLFTNELDNKIINIENYFFTYDFFEKILCRIKKDTTSLWHLPLSELGSDPYDANASDDIKEILGVVGNNLWFYSRCGRLVAVDVESGKIIFMLSGNNKENNINYQRTEGLGDCYFRESDKCIICISSYYFQVIDTVRYEIKEIYNFREQDPNGIGKYSSIYSPLLQGDYFTFLAEEDEDYGGTRRVGIFDYKARKLVWEHEVFTQEEVNQTRVKLLHPRPLKMSEDAKKLYILDSADTLHIFEREIL